jgi:hypothetical protein
MDTLWADTNCADDIDTEQYVPKPSRQANEPRSVQIGCELKEFVDALRRQAKLAIVVGKIGHLRVFASELFLGPIRIDVEEDPEVAGRITVVFNVESKDDVQTVSRHRREWHKRIDRLLGSACEFVQLVIVVRE